MRAFIRFIAAVLYTSSAGLVAKALYQMLVYKNPESVLDDSANVYVGGDAYNYIINSGRATVWAVFALICAVVATGIIIADQINERGSLNYMALREIQYKDK